jgi:hypothetical protein
LSAADRTVLCTAPTSKQAVSQQSKIIQSGLGTQKDQFLLQNLSTWRESEDPHKAFAKLAVHFTQLRDGDTAEEEAVWTQQTLDSNGGNKEVLGKLRGARTVMEEIVTELRDQPASWYSPLTSAISTGYGWTLGPVFNRTLFPILAGGLLTLSTLKNTAQSKIARDYSEWDTLTSLCGNHELDNDGGVVEQIKYVMKTRGERPPEWGSEKTVDTDRTVNIQMSQIDDYVGFIEGVSKMGGAGAVDERARDLLRSAESERAQLDKEREELKKARQELHDEQRGWSTFLLEQGSDLSRRPVSPAATHIKSPK